MSQSDFRKIADQFYPSETDEIMKLAATMPDYSDFLKFNNEGFEHLATLYLNNLKSSAIWWGKWTLKREANIFVRLGEEKKQVGFFVWRSRGQKSFAWFSKGQARDIAHLSLLGYECIFINWKKEGTIELFQNETLWGRLQMKGSRHLIGKGEDGFEFNVNYSLLDWQPAECCWNNEKVKIPPNWPNVNDFPENSASIILQLPENRRNLVVFSLIWRNLIYNWSS